jgi:hypothetical protein
MHGSCIRTGAAAELSLLLSMPGERYVGSVGRRPERQRRRRHSSAKKFMRNLLQTAAAASSTPADSG